MLKDLGDSQREDVWYESEWHVDFSARQRLFGDVEIVVKLNNLSNAREREVYGSPYGRQATAGASARSMVAPDSWAYTGRSDAL